MGLIKNFEEYINEGIVTKHYKDLSRAKFLLQESEKEYKTLNSILKTLGVTEDNANTIVKISYDILMELVRSHMLKDGYNAFGQGAHQVEVSYLRKLGFTENELQFADQLRYSRNGILYYGKIINKDYAEKVVKFIEKNYIKLDGSISN